MDAELKPVTPRCTSCNGTGCGPIMKTNGGDYEDIGCPDCDGSGRQGDDKGDLKKRRWL